MHKAFLPFFILITLLTTGIFGQTGIGRTDLWKWTPDGEHLKSVVKISVSDGMGTGVIVLVDYTLPYINEQGISGHLGYAITANHMVEKIPIGQGGVTATYRNGQNATGCSVIKRSVQKDVAILLVWVPLGIKAVAIANDPIKTGDFIEYVGLGGSTLITGPIRHFEGKASDKCTTGMIWGKTYLIPGDSGGPVFNIKHELVGIISGGEYWTDIKLFSKADIFGDKYQIKGTYPSRSCNVGIIRSLVQFAKDRNKEKTK